MVDLSGIFSDEVEDFKNKAKSEEEIAKYCTKEDLSELQRAVHLLKKGYEVQKLSIINNLDRYMQETGSNEELLALIIGSLDDWDDKMQIECANAFINPLKINRVTPINRQRILRLCIEIVTNEQRNNQELKDAWILVFDNVVGRVSVEYLQQQVLDVIADYPNPKNPMPKRKLGNRLFSGIGKNIGEKSLDEVPIVVRMMQDICQDMSFKIRMDGVLWLKEYLLENHESLRGTARFEDVYLSEIQELLNDESSDVRIEAIEGVLCVLQNLDKKVIEDEFIPNMIRAFNFEKNTEENIQHMSKLIGQIAYKLKPFGLHLKHKEPILDFYKKTCESDNFVVQKAALYNLPCFHLLYRDVVKNSNSTSSIQEEITIDTQDSRDGIEINFQGLYQKFADSLEIEMREVVAAAIHEPFLIRKDEEDIDVIQQVVCELMEEQERRVVQALVPKLHLVIQNYCNTQQLQDCDQQKSPREENKVYDFKHTTTSIGQKVSSMELDRIGDKKKAGALKKQLTTNFDQDQREENCSSNSQYIILPEHKSERIYSELLTKVMTFQATLHSMIGLWREHAFFLENFAQKIHLFHVPEVHDLFAPILFNLIQNGNTTLREAVSKCIVEILIHQHDPERRNSLAKQVITDLAEAGAFTMRKCFLNLCRFGAGKFTRQFFMENFYQNFLALAKDKVPHVRIDFAKSLVDIKPWFESNQEQQIQLSEAMTNLRKDNDQDVADAAENTDFELLKSKKFRISKLQEQEEQCLKLEKLLQERNLKEEEEKKRRAEEEEENKFDFASFMVDNRKKSLRNQGRMPIKKKLDGEKSKGTGTAMRAAGSLNQKIDEKPPLKRPKNGVTKRQEDLRVILFPQLKCRNSSALPNCTELPQVQKPEKDRKNSVMLPMINANPGSIIENKSSKTVPKAEEMIGGMDNYKRYQMLVANQQSQMSGATSGVKDSYKRSLSLFDSSTASKKGPKRTTTMESHNRKKMNKNTDEESSDETPTSKKINATVSFMQKK